MPTVWPFVPQVDASEALEWLTEVIRCQSAEQRLCLRNLPRTSFEYEFQLGPQEIEAATVLARQFGAGEFLIPLWSDLSYLGTVPPGETTLTVDTTTKRYKVGSSVFIVGGDGKYETLTVSALTPTTVSVLSPGVVFGFADAVVMPAYLCRIKSPLRFSKRSDRYHVATMDVILTEDFEISAANSYPSYKGAFVLSDRPTTGGSVVESHSREFEVFPNIAGPLYYSEKYDYNISTSQLNWSFNTDTEVWAFRRLMYDIKGRQKSFYAPRWTHDFIPALATVSANSFIIVERNDTLDDTYTGPITVVKTDGTHVYLTITSIVEYSATQRQLNLDSTVGEDLAVTEIELICRMPKMRFNSDTVDFSYSAGGVTTVRLPIMEVPE